MTRAPHLPLGRLGLLFALYLVQGIPFGFQITALPVLMREAGTSLTAIGFAQLLGLPWLLKLGWAPLVDRFGSPRFGRRKSWIVPLQLGLVGCILVGGAVPASAWPGVIAAVFVANLCVATMDVAVDALAVQVLGAEHLGYGNIAQVVGYKVGMLAGGGLLLYLRSAVPGSWLVLGLSTMVLVVVFATLAFREPAYERDADRVAPTTMRALVTYLRGALAARATWPLLVLVGTYKVGESMSDAMFKPYLFDVGIASEQIGLWVGTYGLVASLAGSVAGGVLASRIAMLDAVLATAILRVVPVAAIWLLASTYPVDASSAPSASAVIGITMAEHFFGGALTTAMFAFMMSRVDPRIGGTHFTLLATVEVLGKGPAGWLSGLAADAGGYPIVFGAATVMSVAYLAVIPWVRRTQPGPVRPAPAA